MKSRRLTFITAMTLFAALALPVQLAEQDQGQQHSAKLSHYKLTVLGTLAGTHSDAAGINNNGGPLRSVDRSVIRDLGSLEGRAISTTFANLMK